MLTDVCYALLKGLGLAALFQATGSALFIALFSAQLPLTIPPIRRLGFYACSVAIFLLTLQYVLEAARMGGDLSSAMDADLQRLVFDSPLRVAWMLRMLSLGMIATALRLKGFIAACASLLGAILIGWSFSLMGHTSISRAPNWLGVALSLHVLIVSFWFGALWPLHIVAGKELPQQAAAVVDRFSRIAVWGVPLIFVAGAFMMLFLIDTWSVFLEPYGALLVAKIVGFALLMALASLNKWRYGPALAQEPQQRILFRRSLAIEFAIIVGILLITAVLTTFFSPGE